jgi:hypothetical protein
VESFSITLCDTIAEAPRIGAFEPVSICALFILGCLRGALPAFGAGIQKVFECWRKR